MEARFKKSGLTIFSRGPKGTARVEADAVVMTYDDGQSVRFRFADLKKAAFNSNNGLWTFHPKEGKKEHFQTTGALFSVGDREAGHAFNQALGAGLAKHGVKGMVV